MGVTRGWRQEWWRLHGLARSVFSHRLMYDLDESFHGAGHLLVSMMRKHSMMIIWYCVNKAPERCDDVEHRILPESVALRGVSIVLKLWKNVRHCDQKGACL